MLIAWKEAKVTPVTKNGNEAGAENYRPISLLCILSKVQERSVYNRIYDFSSSKISPKRNGIASKDRNIFYSTDSVLSQYFGSFGQT